MRPVDSSDLVQLVAAILNGAYVVRMYQRPIQRAARAAAIRSLGLTCRRAFNSSEDFEPLLRAIVDGLKPHDERAF